MKRIVAVVLCLLLVFSIAACGKTKEKVIVKKPIKQEVNVVPPVVPVEPVVDTHVGQGRSYLTGEWVNQEILTQRPLAIMIANTPDVCPQSSVGQAQIIYEVPVEGGITRLLAVFEDYNAIEKIGSVRSCRYYFVYYASEFNALYAHYGQSAYADNLLKNPKVNNISGMDSGTEGKVFYRTNDAKPPHNAFAKGSGVLAFAQKKGYATTYDPSYQGHYLFASDTEPVNLMNGITANKVESGFYISHSYFEYNKEDGNYYRFQNKVAHKDALSKEQLKFKNILVQFSSIGYMPDQKSLQIDTLGSGTGKYITNGKAIDITWEKKEEFGVTHYYDLQKNEIKLNQGKTNVLIIDKNHQTQLIIQE